MISETLDLTIEEDALTGVSVQSDDADLDQILVADERIEECIDDPMIDPFIDNRISIEYISRAGEEVIWKPRNILEIMTAPQLSMAMWATHKVNTIAKRTNSKEDKTYLYTMKEALIGFAISEWNNHYPDMNYGYGYDYTKEGKFQMLAIFDCPGIGQLSFHTDLKSLPEYPYRYTGIRNSDLKFYPNPNYNEDEKYEVLRDKFSEIRKSKKGIKKTIGHHHNDLVRCGVNPYRLYRRTKPSSRQ